MAHSRYRTIARIYAARTGQQRTVSSRLNRTEFTGAWKRSWTVFAHTRVIRRQKSCRLMQRVIVLRRVQSRSTSAHTDFRRRFIDASRTHTLSFEWHNDGSRLFSFRFTTWAPPFCVTETHSCTMIRWLLFRCDSCMMICGFEIINSFSLRLCYVMLW